MTQHARRHPGGSEGKSLRLASLIVTLSLMVLVVPVHAQSDPAVHVRRLLSTPFGGLPPVAMPMPASRDRNYWGLRVQAGRQRRDDTPAANAIAGGIDLQWQGGSVFGLTAGRRSLECEASDADCGDHMMYGARARAGLMSGGPTLAALIGDHNATTTFGVDLGFGYAPRVSGVRDACTVDVGAPVSLSMLQRVRVVTFVSPGVVWDFGCMHQSDAPSAASLALGYGLGVQQLWSRGLDVNFGLQRIFRRGAGTQLGISFIYVRLP